MMEGMRYERGGKGKYWIPKPGTDSRTPLLGNFVSSSRARAMSPGAHRALEQAKKYGSTEDDMEEPELNPEDERLFTNARALEFGDWNVSGFLLFHRLLIRSCTLRCNRVGALSRPGIPGVSLCSLLWC